MRDSKGRDRWRNLITVSIMTLLWPDQNYRIKCWDECSGKETWSIMYQVHWTEIILHELFWWRFSRSYIATQNRVSSCYKVLFACSSISRHPCLALQMSHPYFISHQPLQTRLCDGEATESLQRSYICHWAGLQFESFKRKSYSHPETLFHISWYSH